jgi:hypothetical protein
MNTLVLVLLLLGLVTIGLLMKPRIERFVNPPTPTMTVATSPALANLLSTPILIEEQKPVVQVDTLARDQEIQKAQEKSQDQKAQEQKPACPACPVCPDMSKYIRMDEVPCWNCTLP